MSAQTHGLATLTFGTPTVTGYVVQSFNTSDKCALATEVFDESGKRVHARYDDVTSEMTFSAVLAGATLPTPGTVFTVNSIKYETLTVDKKRENKGNALIEIKGKNSEYLTLS